MTDAERKDDKELEDSRMTLGEHLDELRTRLIRATIAFVVTFVACWVMHEEIAEILLVPYNRSVVWLNDYLLEYYQGEVEKGEPWNKYFAVVDPQSVDDILAERRVKDIIRGDIAGEAFVFYLRFCGYFAGFIAGPYMLFQLWQFIAAGLYRKEKGVVYKYFPGSLALFVGGVLFGYFVMVPYGLYFLAKFGIHQFEWWQSLGKYATFLSSLTLALGIVFQLPILMIAIAKLGLIEPKAYGKYRGHCIIAALVLAAILTPPDPYTQMMMAAPIVILYELGHVLSRMSVTPSPLETAEPAA